MARRSIDWDAIEKDWRAGIKTKLQLSEEYGVSRAAIDKRFSKLGIDRDLSAKIRQKAESILVAQQVTSERLNVTEREIVETNATIQANKIIEHRADIKRYRSLCQTMLSELESESDDPEVFHNLGEMLRSSDASSDKLNDIYRKAISLPQRIDGVKKLSETLKVLIGLERQAFGIADNAEGDKPPEDQSKESSIEIARKIAFAMAQGIKAAQNS